MPLARAGFACSNVPKSETVESNPTCTPTLLDLLVLKISRATACSPSDRFAKFLGTLVGFRSPRTTLGLFEEDGEAPDDFDVDLLGDRRDLAGLGRELPDETERSDWLWSSG